MKKYPLPDLSGLIMTPVQDEDDKIVNDTGRKVIIRTIGGPIYDRREKKDVVIGHGRSLTDTTGTVVKGPYLLTVSGRTAIRGSKGKRWKEIKVTTEPYWLVRLDSSGQFAHFAECELTFL